MDASLCYREFREEGRSPQLVARGLCLPHYDDSSSGHIVEFRGAYAMNNHILSRTIAESDIAGERREERIFKQKIS